MSVRKDNRNEDEIDLNDFPEDEMIRSLSDDEDPDNLDDLDFDDDDDEDKDTLKTSSSVVDDDDDDDLIEEDLEDRNDVSDEDEYPAEAENVSASPLSKISNTAIMAATMLTFGAGGLYLGWDPISSAISDLTGGSSETATEEQYQPPQIVAEQQEAPSRSVTEAPPGLPSLQPPALSGSVAPPSLSLSQNQESAPRSVLEVPPSPSLGSVSPSDSVPMQQAESPRLPLTANAVPMSQAPAMPEGFVVGMNKKIEEVAAEVSGVKQSVDGITSSQRSLAETVKQMEIKIAQLTERLQKTESLIGDINGRVVAQVDERLAAAKVSAKPPAAAAPAARQQTARAAEDRPARTERTNRARNQTASDSQNKSTQAQGRNAASVTSSSIAVVRGWTLKGMARNVVWLQDPSGKVSNFSIGSNVQGLGTIKEIKNDKGNWVVITDKGAVTT